MKDIATVRTYVREGSFVESELNQDVFCKSFDQFAKGDLITEYAEQNTAGLWTVNSLEPLGFIQTYFKGDWGAAKDLPEASSVRCALTSKREEGQSHGYAFKTGQKIEIRGGYKVRKESTDLRSI